MLGFRKAKKKSSCYSPIGNLISVNERADEFLSRAAKVKYMLSVYKAIAKCLYKHNIAKKELFDSLAELSPKENELSRLLSKNISCFDAAISILKKKLSKDDFSLLRILFYSRDIEATAEAIRFRDFTKQLLMPELLKLERALISLSLANKERVLLLSSNAANKRLITLGFFFSSYVSRLGKRIVKINISSNNLKGKLSGIYGTHESFVHLFEDADEFEKEALKQLGLKRSAQTGSVAEPEHLADFMHNLAVLSAIGKSLAKDLLYFSSEDSKEISFSDIDGEAGTDTRDVLKKIVIIANKLISGCKDSLSFVNGIFSEPENAYFWLPGLAAMLLSEISCLNKALKALELQEDNKNKEKISPSKDELLYYSLKALLCYSHDLVAELDKLFKDGKKGGKSFSSLLSENKLLSRAIKKLSKKGQAMINDPLSFSGDASEKAEYVCQLWTRKLNF